MPPAYRRSSRDVGYPGAGTGRSGYWIHTRLHPGVLVALLEDIESGAYRIDAAVLAIAERLNEPRLATLDRPHFGILAPRHVDALVLLP